MTRNFAQEHYREFCFKNIHTNIYTSQIWGPPTPTSKCATASEHLLKFYDTRVTL